MPILVASLEACQKNPDWYYNLKAHPAVKITTIDGQGNYLAEERCQREEDELWPLICSFILTMKPIKVIPLEKYLYLYVSQHECYRS